MEESSSLVKVKVEEVEEAHALIVELKQQIRAAETETRSASCSLSSSSPLPLPPALVLLDITRSLNSIFIKRASPFNFEISFGLLIPLGMKGKARP